MLRWLPLLTACCNATSALLLLGGWRAIRGGNKALHKRCMVGAFVASSLFLVVYLLRLKLLGTHRFVGLPWIRGLYLAILGSHSLLAVVVLPLVLWTFALAWRGDFVRHRRIVRYTLPLWLYVSTTGVVVYVFANHVSGRFI